MHELKPYLPYLILAVICAVASAVIVFVAMMSLTTHSGAISEGSMYAIAAMAAAPALMGIGIASFMPPNPR